MLSSPGQDPSPEPFSCDALSRLPLAETVLSLWLHVLQPRFLDGVFQRHRGRSFEDQLTFPVLVELIADALIRYRGSGRKSFLHARDCGTLPRQTRAAYGKLGRVPRPTPRRRRRSIGGTPRSSHRRTAAGARARKPTRSGWRRWERSTPSSPSSGRPTR
jgi:hypothetical protein